MREILFRGKRVDNGEWVNGYFIKANHHWHEHGVHEDWIAVDTIQNGGWCNVRGKYAVAPETIGQYTGLTDKNGNKIFEGDIVKFGQNLYQITFECGSFALLDKQGFIIAKIGGMNDRCYSLMNLYLECCWEDNWAYDIEVIGNIHDNPELLKESDN